MGIFRKLNENVEKIPLSIFNDYIKKESIKETFYSRTLTYLEAEGDGIISYCPNDEIPLEYSENLPDVPKAAEKYYFDRFMKQPIKINKSYPKCKTIFIDDNLGYKNTLLFFNKSLKDYIVSPPPPLCGVKPLLFIDFEGSYELAKEDKCPGVIEVVKFD